MKMLGKALVVIIRTKRLEAAYSFFRRERTALTTRESAYTMGGGGCCIKIINGD